MFSIDHSVTLLIGPILIFNEIMEKNYYVEMIGKGGKLLRHCIVSKECPNKNWHYEKLQ